MNAKDIKLVVCTDKEQRALFTSIVREFHSYVPQPIAVGRQINYLLVSGEECVGCIGLAQAPNFPSTAIMDYFRLPHSNSYKPRWLELLPTIGNNWRFTLKPNAPENTASRVLGVLLKIGPRDWEAKYGVPLRWVMTFVDEHNPGIKGTIYKAAGWKMIGYSAGVLMEKRGYSQFKNIKATKDPNARKAIYMKAVKPEFALGKVVGAETHAQAVPQADVVQQKNTDLPSQRGVCDSTPSAPLTIRSSSGTQLSPSSSTEKTKPKFHMEMRNGKYTLVKD